jgi:hypothetical protein
MTLASRLVAAMLLLCAACASSPAGGDGDRIDAGDTTADGSVDAVRIVPDASPSIANTIYVSVLGADSNSGTEPGQPVRHIAFALTRAVACTPTPCQLVIAEGEYEESFALVSGVSLLGGFSLDYTIRDILTHPTVIVSDEPRTVIAEGLTAPTLVEGLTIRGADLRQDVTGASTYALWVKDSGDALELRRVTIVGGRAGRGVDGGNGTLTTCDARGGAGGSAVDCGGERGYTGDASGDPVAGSAGGSPGSSYCPNACPTVWDHSISDGTGGDNGGNGNEGEPGTAASDGDGSFATDGFVGAAGLPGARGFHGTGGGGGGPGGTKRFVACFGCGSLIGGRGGDGGRGGCGGTGGSAGGPGGGSFGLVIAASTVLFNDVGVTGGVGGRGGDGGDGHPGSPGSTDGSIGRQGRPQQRCGLIDYQAGAGGAGGIGGHGGHGGGGPGGIGGPAIGIALIGGGEFVLGEPGSGAVAGGTAGDGGTGGAGVIAAPAGTPGTSADVVVY